MLEGGVVVEEDLAVELEPDSEGAELCTARILRNAAARSN